MFQFECREVLSWPLWRRLNLQAWLFHFYRGKYWRSGVTFTHFHITMQNFTLMQRVQAFNNLNENRPYFALWEVGAWLLMLTNFLIDITSIRVVHYETQRTRSVFEENLSVPNHVSMARVRRGNYSMLARMRTSFTAFSFSFAESFPILTWAKKSLLSSKHIMFCQRDAWPWTHSSRLLLRAYPRSETPSLTSL